MPLRLQAARFGRSLVLLAAPLLLAPHPLTAQSAPAHPPGNAAREAVAKVAFLEGSWKGEASIDMGPRGTQAIVQTETVESRLGGAALVVHGLGKSRAVEGQPERVVHEAIGVIYHDEATKGLKILAIKADGASTTSDLVPEAGGWRWFLSTPRGRVRYTISQPNPGEWHEVGEISPDGATWRKFYEMRLQKER